MPSNCPKDAKSLRFSELSQNTSSRRGTESPNCTSRTVYYSIFASESEQYFAWHFRVERSELATPQTVLRFRRNVLNLAEKTKAPVFPRCRGTLHRRFVASEKLVERRTRYFRGRTESFIALPT